MYHNLFSEMTEETFHGFMHVPSGGKHLFEKNLAMLFTLPLLFSANQVADELLLVKKKNEVLYIPVTKQPNSDIDDVNIPGEIDRPSFNKISFLTCKTIVLLSN